MQLGKVLEWHVGEDSTVTWKVNGVENDRLSKIGKGTLHV
ncbi:Adhesion and penetration protein precursor [Haemophilus influenzae]|uniref:Adhesion and penetration protein n=1 Tax=Haemophilus influenzae TaxID=727 RepID=A0A2X1PQY9_HAEIF|nr:Adhesion and penetration protein precursor [Haemophilus influenzae]